MRVGAIQFQPVLGDVGPNLAAIERLVRGVEADLLVLPELCLSGYEFEQPEEIEPFAMDPRASQDLDFLSRLSHRTGITLVGGFVERAVQRLYNSAFVIGPRGLVGVYRKVHLFGDEPRLFRPGDLGFPVFDLDSVRVGVMICFDWLFPEAARSLALAGADVIAHPSNLVLPYAQGGMQTRAIENGVFAITSNRTGRERTLTFTGRSQVVDPLGQVLVSAGAEDEAVIVTEIDPRAARNKWLTPANHSLADRRPDQYRAGATALLTKRPTWQGRKRDPEPTLD